MYLGKEIAERCYLFVTESQKSSDPAKDRNQLPRAKGEIKTIVMVNPRLTLVNENVS